MHAIGPDFRAAGAVFRVRRETRRGSLFSGAFAAAFYLSGKNGSRGWLTGAAVGGIVFCVLTLISLMINRGGLTQNTLFRFVILMLSSVIGGILGVNRKSQHKYI